MPTAIAAPRSATVETVAHRGANLLRTENTLPAFAVALDEGADAIELDVHATIDGVVIVHHDPDAVDTAAGKTRKSLASLTWETAQSIRLRGGERIPRLSEILDLAAGRARVYVEIKGTGIEQAVAQAIAGSQCDCAVHSFDHEGVGRMRDLLPELPRGLLLDEGDVRGNTACALLKRYAARDLWPHESLVDEAMVESVRACGGRIVAWTVNDVTRARALASLGVDALCSDDVPLIGRALASMRSGG